MPVLLITTMAKIFLQSGKSIIMQEAYSYIKRLIMHAEKGTEDVIVLHDNTGNELTILPSEISYVSE